MKKVIALIALACILLSACSGKSRKNSDASVSVDSWMQDILANASSSGGVPDSVVLRSVTVPDGFTHKIVHHYDKASHIDDIELIATYQGKYGTQTRTYAISYQYDKSTDIWSQISNLSGEYTESFSFSEEAYLEHPNFSGEFNYYHSGTYDITIQEIDFENRIAKVSYLLLFDDNRVASSTETMEIYVNDYGVMFISVPYQRSSVVKFEQPFVFNVETGLTGNIENG